MSKEEPKKAYVYQPFSPMKNGMHYAVGGLDKLGCSEEECKFVKGIRYDDALTIVTVCNLHRSIARNFIRSLEGVCNKDTSLGIGIEKSETQIINDRIEAHAALWIKIYELEAKENNNDQ